ncbi:MAG: flagellar biosynthetic protein FliQ [Paracoccaceae bacterium]|jgi:flagellar biosynthetic protein FliQ
MTEGQLIDVLRDGLWTGFVVAAPILIVALVIGVAIGLFQALTSIQEMTLTFVPKLGAIVITYWICMGFMAETLIALWRDRLIPIIAGG